MIYDQLIAEFVVELRDPRPVSANMMYTGKGKRFLSTEGKAFKEALKSEVSTKTLSLDPSWNTVTDSLYKQGGAVHLFVELHLEEIYNAAWVVGGSKTSKGAERSPYKKLDVTNYVKLAEDAVAAGTGVDDAFHVHVTSSKFQAPDDPRIVIRYQAYTL